MLLDSQIIAIVQAVSYKPGWDIRVSWDRDRPYIQLEATTDDSTGAHEPVTWKSGKRYLSPHMCRQEIVGACFALIRDAEEHEMREWFRYKGAAIFNPHLDPDALAELAKRKSSFNARENAMSMEEGTS